MSYETFGHFSGKPVDEVIKAAKKQKLASDITYAVTSPISFALKNGAAVVAGERGQTVSDEQYVKALILKTLKEQGLLPKKNFNSLVKKLIHDFLIEESIVAEHPHWNHKLKTSGHTGSKI